MKLKSMASVLVFFGFLSFGSPCAAAAQDNQAMSSSDRGIKVLADQQLRDGEILAAIENYKKALSSDSSARAVYFNLAIAYYTNNQIEEAAKNLETLAKLSPYDTEAIYNLGCLKLYLGDIQNAEKCFQDAALFCGPASRFKPLLENGLSFLNQVKQLDSEKRKMLFLLFRQGAIPAFIP